MPSAWSNKRERQYEHIKDGARSRGASPRRAKEIAARTVNKQRAGRGETKDRYAVLADQTKQELYAQAQRLDIEGRSRMTKSELARAIEKQR